MCLNSLKQPKTHVFEQPKTGSPEHVPDQVKTGSPELEHVAEQSKTSFVEQVKTGSPEHVLGFGCFDLLGNSQTCSNRGGQFADESGCLQRWAEF